MRGEVPAQIAASLDLSVSAVHAYLRSARRKQECTTLTQAVATAVRLEILC
ncbi:LuxR C-terminal-related transcriptional regulator [Bradyrhizobium sp. STM 3562]|uniref:LuxR C-terminal-related transcriptional regulator n=1 Tax=Bradyrhizobium sp. STM 3562 TaxID=578924 RepID=UPI00388D3A9E